ncbi:PIN domain-containing protein [Ligilactobacillus salivarius]|uniref:Toxin PIN n=1 Tax=Ligilactobacillus salivarius TaxID=1624 RepID=A0A9X6S7V2_9LACO|nr:PIN domain-containing protein [Ligilactobacillus salivarius]MBE7387593.1 PIN domain-containing protein [Ligilactobacillus salivarius]MBE7392003.1 PIN domain-containing protein [Ligilactobacillus salivarius]PAY26298.1 toxin PIN [Ligilactobacillus salivarius]PAY30157.1 toxin PIN [Ligilactobacillus salivarius]PAY33941.1 toxin PIN [Ligilactobacillus salivarius]
MKKVLVDTCVIIDILLDREKFVDDSYSAVSKLIRRGDTICTTAKAMTDIFYIVHHSLHDNDKTKEVLLKLSRVYQILDTKEKDTIKAITSDVADYEDAVMVETAIANKVDFILTRNIKDYKKAKIKVISPTELN